MSESHAEPAQSRRPLSALPAVTGTVAAVGTIAVIVHLRAPIVPPELHAPLVNGTLAAWLFAALCAVTDRICRRFDTRHGELIERHGELIEHLETIARRQEQLISTIADIDKRSRKLCSHHKATNETLAAHAEQLQATAQGLEEIRDLYIDEGARRHL